MGKPLLERLKRWLRHLMYDFTFGRRLVTLWRRSTRWFWLKIWPALNRIVLPGCSGIPLMEIIRHFFVRELWQSAKSLAFSFLMALPPLLIFLFTLIAYFPVDGLQDELLAQLRIMLPGSISDRVSETINDVMGHRHGSLLSIGFIGSVMLAANGMHGLLQSFNSVNHSIEWRPYPRRLLLCLLLVFLLFLMIAIVLCLLVGYKYLMAYLIKQNIVARSKVTWIVFNVGRWLILTVMSLMILSLVYYLAPVKKQRISFFSIGSVLATALFFSLTWGFRVYLNVFNRYNLLYGSIGTLLVVMLWIYWNCVVILVGYNLNITIANNKEGYYVKKQTKTKDYVSRVTSQHRPPLRTETNNYRQRFGSEVWFGPFGSVRYPRTGRPHGTDGA